LLYLRAERREERERTTREETRAKRERERVCVCVNMTFLRLLFSSVAIVISFGLLVDYVGFRVEGVHTFEVHPLFSMERNTVRYGSNAVSVSALATLDPKSVGSTPRKVIVVDFEQFDPAQLSRLNSSHLSGYLIIVPDLFSSSSLDNQRVTDDQIEAWKEKEATLLQHSFDFPIYFAPRTAAVEQFYHELKSSSNSILSSGTASSFGDTYQLVVSGDISPLESPSVTTIHVTRCAALG